MFSYTCRYALKKHLLSRLSKSTLGLLYSNGVEQLAGTLAVLQFNCS